MTQPEQHEHAEGQEPSWFGPAIDKVLGRLFDSGKATVVDDAEQQPQKGNPARPAGPDVEGQVKDAEKLVEEAFERRELKTAADKERLAHDEEHKRVAGLLEKIPEAERKIERLMGWRV